MPLPNPHPPAAIRPMHAGDLPAMRGLIDATGLFPGEMLDGMAGPFLDGSAPGERWLVAEDRDGIIGIAYAAPERMTSGTWNLYLIAVHPDRQGQGHGAAILAHVERLLATAGERLLLVETSGLPGFEGTRVFYRQCGYGEEARIRDFYQAGEDKVVFRKPL